MKKRSLLISLVLLLALAMLVSACGNGGSASSTNLSIVTGGTGGTYYPLGGQMANIINNHTSFKATAQSSGASVENMKNLNSGEVQIAFTQTDIAAYATSGTLMFAEGGALTDIKGIGTLYPETIQIVTLASSGIKSVDELRGKNVSVGAPGSGTYANAEQILAIHGITMDDIKAQHLSFDESTDGLQDGNIDAAFITAGTPTGAVDGLSAVKQVNILPIADDKIAELIAKHPYYAEDVIEAGTYGLASDVKTVAVMAMLTANSKLSEDTVYQVTKAIFENTAQIGHAKGAFIKAETALEGMGIELHPGAAKYFKEKGLSK